MNGMGMVSGIAAFIAFLGHFRIIFATVSLARLLVIVFIFLLIVGRCQFNRFWNCSGEESDSENSDGPVAPKHHVQYSSLVIFDSVFQLPCDSWLFYSMPQLSKRPDPRLMILVILYSPACVRAFGYQNSLLFLVAVVSVKVVSD